MENLLFEMNYKKNYEFLITVYITNFNYGEYIEKSVESVLNQTIKNFEIIIIDDGSTDRSLEILKKYENNKDIKFLKQKNKGLNVTNNIALRISKGKYIIRLDADDWLEKNALEVLSNHMEKYDEIGLVFADYYKVNNKGQIIEEIRRHDFEEVTLLDQPAHGAYALIRSSCLKVLVVMMNHSDVKMGSICGLDSYKTIKSVILTNLCFTIGNIIKILRSKKIEY